VKHYLLRFLQTRCLSEINFEEARGTADKLDAYWREHQKPIGPLHGLPVSLMDRFHIAGLDSTCGFASWIGQVKSAQDEGVLVQQLRRLGAVIFCKTNVPMSVMVCFKCDNPPFHYSISSTDGGDG